MRSANPLTGPGGDDGPDGAPQDRGKTIIAQEVDPGAVLAGTHVLFTTATQFLLDLGGQEPSAAWPAGSATTRPGACLPR